MTNKTTESPSLYDDLEKMPVQTLLESINQEDSKVAQAVAKTLPTLNRLMQELIPRYQTGGRIFYLGAGTSGRLGVLDASEIPPTYGVSNRIIGVIAGGDTALRNPVEKAEDSHTQAWKDLEKQNIKSLDTLIGIAASGSTPYVIEAIKKANDQGLLTACITCNAGSELAKHSQFPLEAIVGPEFVTGSTRMKAGTAQKMLLNMISSTLMIKTGRVKGNKMVNMQLTNHKLIERGTQMLMEAIEIPYQEAKKLLLEQGSVQKAIEWHTKD